jgi:hypothetical protein
MSRVSIVKVWCAKVALFNLWTKRESQRLSDRIGLGKWMTVFLSASIAFGMAMLITVARGVSGAGVILLAAAIAFILAGSLMTHFCQAFSSDSNIERLYLIKRDEVIAAADARTKQRLQDIAQRRAERERVAAERAARVEKKTVSVQMERELMFADPRPKQSYHMTPNGRCWYCQQSVSHGSVQCPYCRTLV